MGAAALGLIVGACNTFEEDILDLQGQINSLELANESLRLELSSAVSDAQAAIAQNANNLASAVTQVTGLLADAQAQSDAALAGIIADAQNFLSALNTIKLVGNKDIPYSQGLITLALTGDATLFAAEHDGILTTKRFIGSHISALYADGESGTPSNVEKHTAEIDVNGIKYQFWMVAPTLVGDNYIVAWQDGAARFDAGQDEGEAFINTLLLSAIRGRRGSSGQDGADGADGAPGADGADGANGAQGPIGPAGADGQDGAQGEPGPAGVAGPIGPQGPAGADGADGEDGQDADGADEVELTYTWDSLDGVEERVDFVQNGVASDGSTVTRTIVVTVDPVGTSYHKESDLGIDFNNDGDQLDYLAYSVEDYVYSFEGEELGGWRGNKVDVDGNIIYVVSTDHSPDEDVAENNAPSVSFDEGTAGTFTGGDNISLTANAADADGDTLSYVWTTQVAGQANPFTQSETGSTFSIDSNASWTGLTIVVTVSDGTATASATFEATIEAPADTTAPAIYPADHLTVTEGYAAFDLTSTAASDAVKMTAYLTGTGIPAQEATGNSITYTFEAGKAAGEYVVNWTAEDAAGNSRTVWTTVTVVAPAAAVDADGDGEDSDTDPDDGDASVYTGSDSDDVWTATGSYGNQASQGAEFEANNSIATAASTEEFTTETYDIHRIDTKTAGGTIETLTVNGEADVDGTATGDTRRIETSPETTETVVVSTGNTRQVANPDYVETPDAVTGTANVSFVGDGTFGDGSPVISIEGTEASSANVTAGDNITITVATLLNDYSVSVEITEDDLADGSVSIALTHVFGETGLTVTKS